MAISGHGSDGPADERVYVRTPAAERGVGRKRQILDVATDVFADHGYEGASLADIAKRCGLSQAGLLHHFRSKADLLVAVLHERDDDDSDQVRFDDQPGALVLLPRLARMLRANLRAPQRITLFARMTVEAGDPRHPAHAWATERYTWTRILFAEAFQRDLDAGRIKAHLDPEVLAGQLVAMMDGLQLQWLILPERTDLAGMFDDFVATLAEGIRADRRRA